MTVRSIAFTLGDLTSELHEVALRRKCGYWNVWDWHLSDADRRTLEDMRDIAGIATTHQERVGEDGMRLVARLLPVRGAAKVAAERARIAQEGPAAFGRHPAGAKAAERPSAAPPRPFQRPAQRWDEAERRLEARLGAEQLLSRPSDEAVDGDAA